MSLSTDAIVSVASINLNVSGSTASIDSMTVNASDFTVTLSGGQSIQITSSDRRLLTVSQLGSLSITSLCTTSNSVTTITNPSAGVQVTPTITPQSSACVVDGGGGGGGSGIAPTIPAQSGAVSTPAVVVTAPTIPAATVATPSPVAVAVSPVFSKILKLGVTSPDVKRLQQLLNSDPDTKITESGSGSPGKESEYFGSLTERALQKFQAKHGLVSSGTSATTGYGALGPKTMAKLEEVFTKVTPAAPAVATPSPVAAAVSPVFNSSLYKGITNSDVKRLQQLLSTDKDVYPEGNTSGYFGALTEKAVQRFQEKYGLAKSGDSGYGFVGPKTRVKLNEVFGGVSAAPVAPVTAPSTPVSTPTPSATPNFDWMNLTPAPSPR